MPIGLELTFSRNLVCKFTDDIKIRIESRLHDLQWQMLGLFDFLRIETIESLADVGHSIDRMSETVSIGAHSGLVLIPFDEQLTKKGNTTLDDFISAIDSSEVDAKGNRLDANNSDVRDGTVTLAAGDVLRRQVYPMLAGAKFSLSVISYELEALFTGVLHSTEALRHIIQQTIDSKQTLVREDAEANWSDHIGLPLHIYLFRTLSSPDLVLLALPQNASQLKALDELFQSIRRLKLRDLLNTLKGHQHDAVAIHGSSRLDADWIIHEQNGPSLKGHALAAVEEFLAFRRVPGEPFEFKAAGTKDFGLCLDFEFSLDCGHDDSVKQKLKQVHENLSQTFSNSQSPKSIPEYLHSLGKHTITGRVHDFAQFVALWDGLWGDYDYRAANLIDSYTLVSFADSRDPQPDVTSDGHENLIAWKVCDAVQEEIDGILRTLTQWARRYLSEIQQLEFLNSIGTFRSCFLHHELASAARDLTPFLYQLSLACSSEYHKDWDEFRNTTNPEDFTEEVSRLIQHLHRAVRNRLEHRSGQADPTLPHTLEHGASKLIGAYSAVTWFCNEIYSWRKRRHAATVGLDYESCRADELAVCVAGGNQGYVNFRILFNDFSQFWEAKHGPLSDAGSGKWSTRLLLLEISGKSLFRPESCLLHCLQETVQYSNWLSAPNASPLAFVLNVWTMLEYRHILIALLETQTRNGLSPVSKVLKNEMTEFLQHFVPYLISKGARSRIDKLLDPERPPTDGVRVLSAEESQDYRIYLIEKIRTTNPMQFVYSTRAYLSSYLPQIEIWREAALELRKGKQKATSEELVSDDSAGRLPFATNRLLAILNNQIVDANDSEMSFSNLSRNVIDLVTEVSSDIGMWCALDHLVSCDHRTPFSRRRRTAIERLRDVHLIFTSIVKSFHERSAQFMSRREAELLLLRWTIQAVAVSNRRMGCESIIEWLQIQKHGPDRKYFEIFSCWDDRPQEHKGPQSGIDVGEDMPNRPHKPFLSDEELFSYIMNLPNDYLAIFGKPVRTENQIALQEPLSPDDCLIALLQGQSSVKSTDRLEFYADLPNQPRNESRGNLKFPLYGDLGPAEQLLWSDFLGTWQNLVTQSKALENLIKVGRTRDFNGTVPRSSMLVGDGTNESSNGKYEIAHEEYAQATKRLAISQIHLVMEMWAKSVRLRFPRAFQPVHKSTLKEANPQSPLRSEVSHDGGDSNCQ